MEYKIVTKALLVCAVLVMTPTSDATAQVKIGVLAPMTGPFSFYGQQEVAAVRLAADEINSGGGIRGNSIEIIVSDTSGKPSRAIQELQTLVWEHNVVAVLGPFSNAETAAAFKILSELQTPMITASATAPYLTGLTGSWGFRTSLTDEMLQKSAIAKWVAKSKIHNVVVISDASGKEFPWITTIVLPTILEKHEIKVIKELSFTGAKDLYSAYKVEEIAKANPDGVIIDASAFDTANIVQQLMKAGFNKTIYATKAPFPHLTAKDFGAHVSGKFYFPVAFWPSESNTAATKFLSKLHITPTIENQAVWPFAPQIYDALYATKEILERSEFRPDDIKTVRQIIRDGWKNLADFQGLVGTFSIDRNGDAVREADLVTISEGEYRLIID